MKNNITELVFIIDRSGSMFELTKDTVGGFNSMLARQKTENGTAFVTTVLFNTNLLTVHDRVPIAEVQSMTERDYVTDGCTALLDAMGNTIKHIASIHKYARAEDVPEHTLFVIITDGLENASRRFNADEVRKLVKHEQEKYGWEFVFLAANIDAVSTAASYGIDRENAVDYHADSTGTFCAYEAMSNKVSSVRNNEPKESKAWRNSIDRDFSSRNKD